MADNSLYFGDNLDILRHYIPDNSVDLVYLDPPFKSDQDYNVLFTEQDGTRSAAQIQVFKDTWKWDDNSSRAYEEIVESGQCDVSDAMRAFRTFLGTNDLLAYLAMMAPRLLELRRVLKPTGGIYLHCDPTASHYLKMLMDAVFSPKNFRNEIIWHYRKWPSGSHQYQRNHDVLLFYTRTRTNEHIFHKEYMPRTESTRKRFGNRTIISGRDAEGNRVPSMTDDTPSVGVPLDDVWDIGRVPPIKQLFPTQKPMPLLERILKVSSEEGQVVLDPFCGCGTTVLMAARLKRKWIGIDITHLAISLIRHRLQQLLGDAVSKTYEVIGEPTTLSGAQELANTSPHQFEWWALGKVDARPTDPKKGADKGIDGIVIFHDDDSGTAKKIILQVKSGHVSRAHMHELRGVVEREEAVMGVFITMRPPTRPMRNEAASAGFYVSPTAWGEGRRTSYARLQILTVEDLLQGKKIDRPPSRTPGTYKTPKGEKGIDAQQTLGSE